MRRIVTAFTTVGIAALAVVGGATAAGGTASTRTIDAACDVVVPVSFNPGLLFSYQQNTISVSGNNSAAGPTCPLTLASLHGTLSGNVACSVGTQMLGTANGRVTLTWADSSTSLVKVMLSRTESPHGGSFQTIVGKVRSGTYAGDTVKARFALESYAGSGDSCNSDKPLTALILDTTGRKRRPLPLTFSHK